MSTNETEFPLLETALANLRAEGYDVYRRPPPSLIPAFMAGYRPDVVAIGPRKSLAIDFIVEGSNVPKKKEVKDRFTGQKDWEYRVIYVRSDSSGRDMQNASREAIERSLSIVEQLEGHGLTSAALLIGWATLEALGRRVCPDHLRRPQTPGRLVEVLASEGELTPDEADRVRPHIQARNRLIHGDLNVEVARESVQEFSRILRRLLEHAELEPLNA